MEFDLFSKCDVRQVRRKHKSNMFETLDLIDDRDITAQKLLVNKNRINMH